MHVALSEETDIREGETTAKASEETLGSPQGADRADRDQTYVYWVEQDNFVAMVRSRWLP